MANGPKWKEENSDRFLEHNQNSAIKIVKMDCFNGQHYGLRKITRSPKVPNHKILGAQHVNLYENIFLI